MRYLLPLCIVMSACGVAIGAPVDLAPKFKTNDAVVYRVDEAATQTVSGATETVRKATTSVRFRLQCVKPAGAAAGGEPASAPGGEFDLTYQWVSMVIDSPAGPLAFDSDVTEAVPNMLRPALKPLVGLTLRIQADEAGRVVNVSGDERIAKNPGARFTSRFTTATSISDLLTGVLAVRPASAKPDEQTWTVETVLPPTPGLPSSGKLVERSTLAGVTDGQATITSVGSATLEPQDLPAKPDGTPGGKSPSIKMQREATLIWDLGAGQLASSTRTETTTVELQVDGKPVKSVNVKTSKLARVDPANPVTPQAAKPESTKPATPKAEPAPEPASTKP